MRCQGEIFPCSPARPSNGPYHGWWGSVSLKQRRSWLQVAYSYRVPSKNSNQTAVLLISVPESRMGIPVSLMSQTAL